METESRADEPVSSHFQKKKKRKSFDWKERAFTLLSNRVEAVRVRRRCVGRGRTNSSSHQLIPAGCSDDATGYGGDEFNGRFYGRPTHCSR